ncbi:hypothetical protein K0M31_010502 [Melipona bicolor]|uniref:Uncharacterized protein n=1 Tax=Melipona bicolor TaxID=60889 RepID=A0AA40FL73_9HYME|nr:hypothetical protein K0M31_010502 [Melipona bicolor]
MRPWVFVKPLIDGRRKDSLLAVTMLRRGVSSMKRCIGSGNTRSCERLDKDRISRLAERLISNTDDLEMITSGGG